MVMGQQRLLPVVLLLGRRHDLLAVQLVPGGGDDGGVGVDLPQELKAGFQLGRVHILGAAQDDEVRRFHLVFIKFPEILQIHLRPQGVRHGDLAAGLPVVPLQLAHGGVHVAELAHAAGLDEDAVRVETLHHFPQGLGEIPHQAAADAAGVHLRDLDARLLEEAAVDADLPEFIFDQHQLFPGESLLDELLDEGGLPRPQETGNNVDLSHNPSPRIRVTYIIPFSPVGRNLFPARNRNRRGRTPRRFFGRSPAACQKPSVAPTPSRAFPASFSKREMRRLALLRRGMKQRPSAAPTAIPAPMPFRKSILPIR